MMQTSLQASSFTQSLARLILRLTAWKLVVNLPPEPRYLLVGAPHTSNWDLWHTLLIAHGAGIKANWIGKDSIFRGLLGSFLRWLGGIPVNRRSSNNFVQQIVNLYNQAEHFVVAIAPEGTRSAVNYWRTGFYYIALGAKVPIAFGFVDYRTRTLGVGGYFMPTGDLEADFAHIRDFYRDKVGRRPQRQGEIKLLQDLPK